MPLRKYKFEWITSFRDGTTENCVLCAEDVKDAIVMFEHEHREGGILPKYSIAAIASDACSSCLGFPHEQPEKCPQCGGSGTNVPLLQPTPARTEKP